MAPSSTIQSYYFDTSKNLLVNQWGWQDNGATVAPPSGTQAVDWYQFGQTAQTVGSGVGTGVGVQIWDNEGHYFATNTYASTTYYVGTAGGSGTTDMLANLNNQAVAAYWKIVNPSGQTVLDTTYYWPQNASFGGVILSLYNKVINYQNVFVSPSNGPLRVDFYSGAGQFTYSGPSVNANNLCNRIPTAENSNMIYSTPSCGSNQCTQSFNAPSGYVGHNAPPANNFPVLFGNGWGTDGVVVEKGDLLIATEATYSGGVTFNTPTDTQLNTWTLDGGGVYCSSYDCVAIWHAVAKSGGTDTVTFYTSATSTTTYGFLREFIGYGGAVRTSAHNSGTSGTPYVSSISPSSGDLVVAVAVDSIPNPAWQPGQYYYMMGSNTGWAAATEFSPGWQHGSTTAPWGAPSGGQWAELAVVYSHP